MTAQPLLSIGLFVYNGERFISDAIESLLGQTFTDFELIISDNASTDRTGEICQRYVRQDRRVRYYRNHKNMGAGWNIRRVVELASGKYFKWAACDDRCEPQFLERSIAALEGDSSVVLAHSRTRVIAENGEFLEYYDWPMDTASRSPVNRFAEMLLNDHMCYQIFGVIRREALDRVPPQGSYVNSDGVLLAQLSFLGPFYEDPDFLFVSRRHSAQSSRTLPVRVKQRRFRLTNRYGTLPCPEWWDPMQTKSFSFPEWRQLREYTVAATLAPISTVDRARALLLLPRWVVKHFRRMMKDLVIAADQVLYNLQMARVEAADLTTIKGGSA